MKLSVIFIPGFGANASVWSHALTHLKDLSPEVIVLDQEKNRSEMVQKVLQQTKGDLFLVGHSMGGWVAQAIAAEAPERIKKLVLISTWTRHHPEMIARQKQSAQAIHAFGLKPLIKSFAGELIFPRDGSEKILAHVENMLLDCQTQQLINQIEAMTERYETFSLLKKITASTLVISGKQDMLFPEEEQKILSSTIPLARLALIDECGHMAPLEAPQTTTTLIRLWLESSF